MSAKRISLSVLSIGLGLGLVFGLVLLAAAASQVDIAGPPGSGSFGGTVAVLPNGNIVVSDPSYDAGSAADVGAVYLYDGASGALISRLTGSTPGDQVSSDGVTALANGNFVVGSPEWVFGAGAVTLGDGTSGVTGTVSAANSLVGSTAGDWVGHSVTALANGNYVVLSPNWHNGAAAYAGAATWGDGTSGVTGTVSAANSLVGSTAYDHVGVFVTELANGNYVVGSLYWAASTGAVTWGDGTSGVTGTVSAANSLVGGRAYDVVDSNVTALANGNYVVRSPNWGNGAGAVTWGDGTSGVTGTVSAANSLVGSAAIDLVGLFVAELANGNYVVGSPYWDNGAAADAGAVTWGDGTRGVTGTVSAANSLVGSTAGDQVGWVEYHFTVLANGNYVVGGPYWDNGAAVDAGAATWGDGTSGVTGTISAANSLVSSTALDHVGYYVTALANGNYVVGSPVWDNGATTSAGAATWGDGTSGVTGTVSAANSLVGSTAGDWVGEFVTVLVNGNYVVGSPGWDYGAAADAGAITWGDGTTGVTGTVSAANSLVGSTVGDWVGHFVTALANGSFVVGSPEWHNGAAANAGAVTWGDGRSGVTGLVSAANSLVGSTADDWVGEFVTVLANGNYVVRNPYWDNGAAADAGAATWGDGTSGVTGTVSAANSLVGSTSNEVGDSVTALANGNYVVSSPYWDNDATVDAGAVTWGDGTSGVTGTVSAANSLVGSAPGDQIGSDGVTVLVNGNYVVRSPNWDSAAAADSGAVTWGNGSFGTIGPITADNSVRGAAAGGGSGLNYANDDLNQQLVVGRPGDNIVTLFRPYLANQAPLADAGSDQTVKSLSTIMLDGSASHDPDGNLPLAYGWTQSGGTVVMLSSATAASPTFTAPAVVTQTSTLTFILLVTDSLGLPSLPDQVAILVEPYPNDPPLADAGSDQTVRSLSTVTLDGSASHDPDGNLPLAYGWTQSGGTAVMLSSTTAASPTFTAPAVVTQTSILTFTLVVTDSLGLSSPPDQVVIMVEPNDPPLADAGSNQTVKSYSTVALDGSASYDPDGNLPLAYGWKQSGGTAVTLSSSTAVSPTFTAPSVVTQTSILTFTLVVTDSLGLSSPPDQVVIMVEPYPVLLPVILRLVSP